MAEPINEAAFRSACDRYDLTSSDEDQYRYFLEFYQSKAEKSPASKPELPGMTLRERIAIAAMQSLIATGKVPRGGAYELAVGAWSIADAMLKVREQGL